jgi:hypothetical protein
MSSNLAIDPDQFDRALDVRGERAKTATVTRALAEFIARRPQRKLLELKAGTRARRFMRLQA